MEHEQQAEQAATNILAMIAGVTWSREVIHASLKFAYTAGARDQQTKTLMEMVQKDDELAERT